MLLLWNSEFMEIVALVIGVLLLLKRVAEMDRYQTLRVVVLTLILSCFAVYFLVGFVLTPFSTFDHSCCEF